MKILILTQWYNPIKAAAARRTSKIAHYLARKGHQVTVLTGMPSYPTGILEKKYKGKLWCKEKEGKIEIIRTYEYPTPNKGVLKRLLNNFSFLVSASIAAFLLPKYDAIIFSSPPFISGLAGILAKKIHRTDFFFDVRDLWPDSPIEVGLLRQKPLIRLFEAIERLYLRNAKKILVATPGIKRHLMLEKIPENKVQILLNSIDTDFFKPQKIAKKNFGFQENDFIVCYTGNHNQLYDLEVLLKAANQLKKYPKIKFLFVGEGEEKEKLIQLKERLNLENVTFLSEKTAQEIAKIVNISEIGAIPVANIGISQQAIPMKTSEYLGLGKPVLASISSDLKKMLENSQSGLIFPAGNHKKAAEAILKLYQNPRLRQKMGQNARKLALAVFSNKKFYDILDQNFPID